MEADTYSIHAVVYLDQGWWVAQCLEYDLCTASRQLDELPRKLLSQLRTQIAADRTRGKQPFEDLPKAPERFWKLYGEGRPIPLEVREPWLTSMLRRLRKYPEEETAYLLRSPKNATRLIEAIAELEQSPSP